MLESRALLVTHDLTHLVNLSTSVAGITEISHIAQAVAVKVALALQADYCQVIRLSNGVGQAKVEVATERSRDLYVPDLLDMLDVLDDPESDLLDGLAGMTEDAYITSPITGLHMFVRDFPTLRAALETGALTIAVANTPPTEGQAMEQRVFPDSDLREMITAVSDQTETTIFEQTFLDLLGMQWWAAIPLMHRHEVYGVIGVGYATMPAWTERHARLGHALARIASLALYVANQYAEAARGRTRAELVVTVSSQISRLAEEQTAVRLVTDQICQVADADLALLFVMGDDGYARLRTTYGLRNPDAPSLLTIQQDLRWMATISNDQIVTWMAEDSAMLTARGRFLRDEDVQSYVAVPLQGADALFGVLMIGRRTARAFQNDEVAFLRQLTSQMGIAIENAQLYSRFTYLAMTDQITGLSNHRDFVHRLTEELARARRYGEQCAVLMIDLDNFKTVNDTLGHRAGDALLRDVAQHIFKAHTRPYDTVARYGGDEFSIILSRCNLPQAIAFAQRVLEQFTNYAPANIDVPAGLVGASIGVAVYPIHLAPHTHTADALIEVADAAMYRAKHGGKRRVVVAEAPGDPLRAPTSA